MTIRSARANPPTEADAGKWAVPGSPWRNGFAGRPILIVKVAKSRVYYRDTSREWINMATGDCGFVLDPEGAETFMKTDSLQYICDTLEEATKLENLSRKQDEEITVSTRQIQTKYEEIIAKLLT